MPTFWIVGPLAALCDMRSALPLAGQVKTDSGGLPVGILSQILAHLKFHIGSSKKQVAAIF